MTASGTTTRDAISGGALTIEQSKDGYRFGVDAVLLATDLPPLPEEATVVELGAGQGAVTLSIAARHPGVRVRAYERQKSLHELLERNARANGLSDRVEATLADVRDREALEPHSADLVVMNPPYHRVGHGRAATNPERAAARSELHGGIADFVSAAQYVARPGAHLKLILPPLRLDDLVAAITESDFRAVSVRFVHPRSDEPAYLMEWVHRRGGSPDLVVRPPLVMRDGDDYTAEVAERLDTSAVEVP